LELQDKYALCALGKCLASGQGVQKNSKLAEEYLRCAGMIDPVWGKENYIGFDGFCRGVMGGGGLSKLFMSPKKAWDRLKGSRLPTKEWLESLRKPGDNQTRIRKL